MFNPSIIEESGAKFEGIQKFNRNKFALVTDPQTHSTYYLPLKGLTKQRVENKLSKEREKCFKK